LQLTSEVQTYASEAQKLNNKASSGMGNEDVVPENENGTFS